MWRYRVITPDNTSKLATKATRELNSQRSKTPCCSTSAEIDSSNYCNNLLPLILYIYIYIYIYRDTHTLEWALYIYIYRVQWTKHILPCQTVKCSLSSHCAGEVQWVVLRIHAAWFSAYWLSRFFFKSKITVNISK